MKENLSRLFQKTLALFKTRPITSTMMLAALCGLGFWGISAFSGGTAEARYVTGVVKKGTIMASVTGSGQVAAMSQIDLKPKVSGDIISVRVVQGQEVKQGQILAVVDPQAASRAVRDAEVSLETAKLSLAKLKAGSDQLTLTQSENALSQARQSKQTAQDTLAKDYDAAFTAISDAFLDLPDVVTGYSDILYGTTYSAGQQNIAHYYDLVKNLDNNALTYRDSAANDYKAAKSAYDKNFLAYKSISRYSDHATIEATLNETYDTAKALAQALKSTDNLLSYAKDTLTSHSNTIPTQLSTHITNTGTHVSTLNGVLQSLLSAKNALKSDKNALVNADYSISEKQQSFDKVKAGADAIDLRNAELTVLQRQNTLADAQASLADYYIRAPFDGTVAKLSAKKGDVASSATSIATLVTPQQMATLTLNEVDAAKVGVGQKATLTFDAVNDLSVAGTVAEVDTIGTVSQGVVSYGIQIVFASQDERVRPGMTVNASIIIDARQDVLMVPSSAVKTQGGVSYVQVFDTPPPGSESAQGAVSAVAPQQIQVEVGLSSTSAVEIVSGLTEGQSVVTRTITSASQSTAQSSAPSLLGGGGGTRTGGGSVRVPPGA